MYHHPPHRDNVTAPDGRPNLRSRLHFGHNREGGPRSPQGTCGGIEEKPVKDSDRMAQYKLFVSVG
jgi:hypothetical protein